jgi:hypothetical protein
MQAKMTPASSLRLDPGQVEVRLCGGTALA